MTKAGMKMRYEYKYEHDNDDEEITRSYRENYLASYSIIPDHHILAREKYASTLCLNLFTDRTWSSDDFNLFQCLTTTDVKNSTKLSFSSWNM